ncbi:MAG: nickel-dependent hydrogenase large subunit [Candidatus Binatia bacterium]
MTTTRTITVQALARVEGEGGLTIRVHDGVVEGVELRIYEPPRFFEGLLRGRAATEAPDITARICGICPVAYQMSAVHAIEQGLGVTLPPALRLLRRLLYCGEWIESHTLHVHMLHAPDFLGFESAVAMAQASPALAEVVRRALRIKKIGNRIVSVVGGREVHPINVRVGGFFRAPRREELTALVDDLAWARDAAIETVRWAAGLEFPDFGGEYEVVALRHPDEYPMNEGRLVSSRGLDIAPAEYAAHFEERQVPHSNALQAQRVGGGSYFVGPLARWNLNADRVRPIVREVATAAAHLAVPETNPFRSIVVRTLEVLQALDDALALIAAYDPPAAPAVELQWRAGVGHAITEAPRGILYHRYVFDDAGMLTDAVIVPPTSQNQAQIERDLLRLAPELLRLPRAAAALEAEKVIRSYDPCISCATHFLTLTVEE